MTSKIYFGKNTQPLGPLCIWQCFNFFLSSFATLRSSCRFNIFNSQWKRTLHYWLNFKKMMKSLSKKTSLHTSFRFGVLFPYGILKSMSRTPGVTQNAQNFILHDFWTLAFSVSTAEPAVRAHEPYSIVVGSQQKTENPGASLNTDKLGCLDILGCSLFSAKPEQFAFCQQVVFAPLLHRFGMFYHLIAKNEVEIWTGKIFMQDIVSYSVE